MVDTTTMQTFDYFCVIDFEATCQENNKDFQMEIIEFPAVMIDAHGAPMHIDSTFQMYVRPTINKQLSDYCTQLTSITQQQVDSAKEFTEVYGSFLGYLAPYGTNILFITCGDWDLKTMLVNQCAISSIPINDMFNRWCNIKKMYNQYYSEKIIGMHIMKEIINGEYMHDTGRLSKHHRVRGMKSLLNRLNLSLDGRHHSGIDDSKNIAKAVIKMCSDGCVFENTWPKRNVGEELIESLKAIKRGEYKSYEIKIDEPK